MRTSPNLLKPPPTFTHLQTLHRPPHGRGARPLQTAIRADGGVRPCARETALSSAVPRPGGHRRRDRRGAAAVREGSPDGAVRTDAQCDARAGSGRAQVRADRDCDRSNCLRALPVTQRLHSVGGRVGAGRRSKVRDLAERDHLCVDHLHAAAGRRRDRADDARHGRDCEHGGPAARAWARPVCTRREGIHVGCSCGGSTPSRSMGCT